MASQGEARPPPPRLVIASDMAGPTSESLFGCQPGVGGGSFWTPHSQSEQDYLKKHTPEERTPCVGLQALLEPDDVFLRADGEVLLAGMDCVDAILGCCLFGLTCHRRVELALVKEFV